MSVWTHIAGIIRLNHLPIQQTQLSEDELVEAVKDKSPVGSEGGLDISAVRTQVIEKYGCSVCWGAVFVYGDLRGFGIENFSEIKAWLDSLESNIRSRVAMIRQAIIIAEPENGEPVVYFWDGDKFNELGLKISRTFGSIYP